MVNWQWPSGHQVRVTWHHSYTHTRWTESSRSTDRHVIGATCDGQTDQCAKRMVCRRRRKSTSSSLLQQQGPSWPSTWRQELLCASPQKLTNQWTYTHTHLTALFPGLPRWASTRKVKPIWILLKQETETQTPRRVKKTWGISKFQF